MRGLQEVIVLSSPVLPPPAETVAAKSEATAGTMGFLWRWASGCHGWWLDAGLVVPSFLFLVFLLSQAKKSITKLAHGRSYIMITYYALLWIVAVLNFLWCLLQAWQCTAGKEFAWNLLSLLTTTGMLFLEVSLLAFLLQGNQYSGLEALMRTLIISGIIVCFDFFLKAIYIFGFGVPLFVDNKDEQDQHKWILWVFHRLLLTSVYAMVFFMHHTKWRDRLPARPAFYNYTGVMLFLNATALFACALMGIGAGFGFWLYSLTVLIYHALYLPLIYLTFLSDFFLEEDLHLENVYYSEMKDAGFFDGDWE
ncbi:protein CANDIDATE G-PROTEIN COUPLED RECEPTOR 2-like [Nymphaea colorata]|nr:protein CANDIDATE G-PROTEIN COUPLED RECEPTOR 2-like [Nymphaea colorata]